MKPNIIIIFADDLGYGDVNCFNSERCKIPTPNINRLAEQGMMFTDAHASSAVCTPSRYSILTGRYSWRSRLQRGVMGYGEPLIAADRMTIAGMLKENGYHTAGFGKWHLGFGHSIPGDPDVRHERVEGLPLDTVIHDGPVTRGFDSYYWHKLFARVTPTPNWTMIENDTVVEKIGLPELLPRLTERGRGYLRERASSDQPFFMYWAPPVPHWPIVPTEEWRGRSGIGEYGDYVMALDGAVGELMAELEANGQDKDTLVIFSSDNGAARNHVEELEEIGHYGSAQFRGHKSDIWEGGHRIPLVVRWPGVVDPGTSTQQLTCLLDIMATCADILNVDLPDNTAEDSVSMLPVLQHNQPVERGAIVHHSFYGYFGIRKDRWKVAFAYGSGGFGLPREGTAMNEGLPPLQVYDMDGDEQESENMQEVQSEVIAEMRELLQRYVSDGRSTPGTKQNNDVPIIIEKQLDPDLDYGANGRMP